MPAVARAKIQPAKTERIFVDTKGACAIWNVTQKQFKRAIGILGVKSIEIQGSWHSKFFYIRAEILAKKTEVPAILGRPLKRYPRRPRWLGPTDSIE